MYEAMKIVIGEERGNGLLIIYIEYTVSILSNSTNRCVYPGV